MSTRILFVDDSGKPDERHLSRAVVIGGFAIDSEVYPSFSRRVLGAKRAFHPNRGVPQAWEMKSSAIIKPNPWKRSKNRGLCQEIVRLVGDMGGTAYSTCIIKRRMHHPMTLATTMPLQLQALVEHFDAECRTLERTGMVVADWSSHHQDQHASRCVASFVASRELSLHPGVYYASSYSNEGIQVSDLVAGIRRRCLEGDDNIAPLDAALASVRASSNVTTTVKGRAFRNYTALF